MRLKMVLSKLSPHLLGSNELNQDEPWWRHQIETISALLALCYSPVPVNSLHKGQWRGVLMFSLICVWINGWVNNREAGDLRRHRGHYDVNVMLCLLSVDAYHNCTDHGSVVTSICCGESFLGIYVQSLIEKGVTKYFPFRNLVALCFFLGLSQNARLNVPWSDEYQKGNIHAI